MIGYFAREKIPGLFVKVVLKDEVKYRNSLNF
jgi:hypothetical protein